MPKKLTILTALLVIVLGTATPAVAQEQGAGEGQYGPVPGVDCHPQVDQQVAQAAPQEEEPAVPPAASGPEGGDANQPFDVTGSGDDASVCSPVQGVNQAAGNTQNGVPEAAFDAPASCGNCGVRVVEAARDALTGGGSGTSNDPADAFGAALQAARDAGGTREAAASEEAGAPVEETPAYQAAFEAAKEAGADDATAKEAAERAVAGAVSSAGGASASKTSKVRKGDSGEGTAEGKTHKDKTREEETATDDGEAADEEAAVVSGGEDGGSGEAATTPAGSKVPLLLLGGVALLSVGGYASLRFARSWSSVRGRKLLQN